MFSNFAILFIPAILITMFTKFLWSNYITTKESLISLGINLVMALLTLLIFSAYINGKLSDVEIWNGSINSKKQVKVSCSHSYSCPPCIETCDTDGKNCIETCDTCYDHPYDFDWIVSSTIGNFEIARVDPQGLNMPRLWSEVKLGEPASRQFSYQNYLLADKNSIFVESEDLIKNYLLPNYPAVYNYYRINRIVGKPANTNSEDINNYINDRLKILGFNKQLNVIVVFTKHSDTFFNALMAAWKGGKKNDVILVFGLDEADNIKWFNSNSYARGTNNREMHTTFYK